MKLESDPHALSDLISSLHALDDYVDAANFEEAASILATRMIDAKSADKVGAFDASLKLIDENLDQGILNELGSRLGARARMESDPDLLRAYGKALGSLPVGSLSAAQVENLAPIFAIPNAPCQVATRVEGNENLGRLVRQILNPLCSEDGWMQNVVALDGLTKQSIVHGTSANASDGDTDPDFAHLIVADDDDESSPAANSASQGNGIEVDFNKLSQVLAPLRPMMPIPLRDLVAPVASALLLLISAVLFFFAWRSRIVRLSQTGPASGILH
jgi:hypothetical protein